VTPLRLDADLVCVRDEARVPDVVPAGFLDQAGIQRAHACAVGFVVSTHDETWGLVINEAMNFGLPVVATDWVGCTADLVVDGRNGFVVPSRDREALARALQTLVDSAELRQRFGQASIEVISQWTYDRTAAGLCHAVAAAVGAERWRLAG
jgi:glycosyltransferase involved in cell wall biosynthesis